MQNRKRDTDVQNSLLDSVGEGEGGMFQENSIETCILSRVKQTTSPGWMHETSARTWCTGKTQRERMEREVGGGIGIGNTCKPMAVSFQCMTKSTTNKKKIIIKEKNISSQNFNLLNFLSFFCRLTQDLSQRMFHVQFRRMCIMLLYGLFQIARWIDRFNLHLT